MSELLNTLLAPCAATIEIGGRPRAMQVALSEMSIGIQNDRLVIWSDGSHRERGSGMGIAWRNTSNSSGWSEQLFMLDPKYDNNIAELFAFLKAVQIARQICSRDERISRLFVYIDSTYVLWHVSDHDTQRLTQRLRFPRQIELAEIKAGTNEISIMGINVILRWVPGHSGVSGNVRADQLATRASMASHGSSMESFVPPTNGYIESRIGQKEMKTALRKIRQGRIEKNSASKTASKRAPTPASRSPSVPSSTQTLQPMTVSYLIPTPLERLQKAYTQEKIENLTAEMDAKDPRFWFDAIEKSIEEQLAME